MTLFEAIDETASKLELTFRRLYYCYFRDMPRGTEEYLRAGTESNRIRFVRVSVSHSKKGERDCLLLKTPENLLRVMYMHACVLVHVR